jgi:hypothetical protein
MHTTAIQKQQQLLLLLLLTTPTAPLTISFYYVMILLLQPMLRSMLGGVEVCLEGLGEIDSRLRTVGLWLDKGSSVHALAGARIGDPVYRRGLVYYLRGDKVSFHNHTICYSTSSDAYCSYCS